VRARADESTGNESTNSETLRAQADESEVAAGYITRGG
jgi:hypothetical protein